MGCCHSKRGLYVFGSIASHARLSIGKSGYRIGHAVLGCGLCLHLGFRSLARNHQQLEYCGGNDHLLVGHHHCTEKSKKYEVKNLALSLFEWMRLHFSLLENYIRFLKKAFKIIRIFCFFMVQKKKKKTISISEMVVAFPIDLSHGYGSYWL
jgi:hypothetical protein